MKNLDIYNRVRGVPENAQKTIVGGRLKGMTDINPMWRIKTLTEQFGACGVGWYYKIADRWTESGAGGEISAFISIELYIKVDGEWSMPIVGTGGSSFVAKERNGLYTSDECFKMALTDAISVSCKSLGFGADIYWNKDKTKYTPKTQLNDDASFANETSTRFQATMDKVEPIPAELIKKLREGCFVTGTEETVVAKAFKKKTLEELTEAEAGRALKRLNEKADKS